MYTFLRVCIPSLWIKALQYTVQQPSLNTFYDEENSAIFLSHVYTAVHIIGNLCFTQL